MDKWGVSKIHPRNRVRGHNCHQHSPPISSVETEMLFSHLGTKILPYMGSWCEGRAGGAFRQPRPGGDLEERQGVMQNDCKPCVCEPDKIKACLEQSGSQAGQQSVCLSCVILTAFSKKGF